MEILIKTNTNTSWMLARQNNIMMWFQRRLHWRYKTRKPGSESAHCIQISSDTGVCVGGIASVELLVQSCASKFLRARNNDKTWNIILNHGESRLNWKYLTRYFMRRFHQMRTYQHTDVCRKYTAKWMRNVQLNVTIPH